MVSYWLQASTGDGACGWREPVSFRDDIRTSSTIAKYINCTTLPFVRDSEFIDNRAPIAQGIAQDIARKANNKRCVEGLTWSEQIVRELLEVYQYRRSYRPIIGRPPSGFHETDLLWQAALFAESKHCRNTAYVEYAIGECLMANGKYYLSRTFREEFLDILLAYNLNSRRPPYFLDRTRRLQFTVGIEQVRASHVPLVDVPFEADTREPHFITLLGAMYQPQYIEAKHSEAVDFVLLFLRYGAAPLLPADGIGKFVYSPAKLFINQLLMRAHHRATTGELSSMDDDVVIQRLLRCLRLMWRANPRVYRVYRQIMQHVLTSAKQDDCVAAVYQELEKQFRAHFRSADYVPSLLRSTRCVIRGVLLRRRQLPDGVTRLSLSEPLLSILDLQED